MRRLTLFIFCLLTVAHHFAQQPRLMISEGHDSKIEKTVFSPNGKYLVTFTFSEAKVWNTQTGYLIETFRNVTNAAAFSDDGKFLALVRMNPSAVILYETATWKPYSISNDWPGGNIRQIAFTKDGRHLNSVATMVNYSYDSAGQRQISIYNDSLVVRNWDCQTGRLLTTQHFKSWSYFPYTVSESCNRIALIHLEETGNKDLGLQYFLQIRDIKTGGLIRSISLNLKDKTISGRENIQFSPDDKFILLEENKGSVYVWSAENNTLYSTWNRSEMDSSLIRIGFSSRPGELYACYSYPVGPQTKYLTRYISLLKGKPVTIKREYSNDEQGSVDQLMFRDLSIIEAKSGKVRSRLSYLKKPDYTVQFSPDGSRILLHDRSSRLRILETRTGKILKDILIETNSAVHFGFHDEDKTLYVVSGKDLLVHDQKTGRFLRKFAGHTGFIDRVVMTPGHQFITTGKDSSIRFWDYPGGMQTGMISRLYISPNDEIKVHKGGKKLYHRSSAGDQINIYEIPSGNLILSRLNEAWADHRELILDSSWERVFVSNKPARIFRSYRTLNPPDKELRDSVPPKRRNYQPADTLEINPGGNMQDSLVSVWDLTGGQLVTHIGKGKLPGGLQDLFRLALDKSEKRLLIEKNNDVQIWDINADTIVSRFNAYIQKIIEEQLIITDGNGSIRIFDFYSGRLVSTFTHGYRYTSHYFYSENGKYFTAFTPDSLQLTWDAASGKRVREIKTDGIPEQISFPAQKFIGHNTSLFDLGTGKLLYNFIAVDSTDYLVRDKKGRFDGTEAARKSLYFICNNEIIDLEQLKDQLWVPGLAERIMRGDPVNTKTLEEMNICGLAPVVEEAEQKKGLHRFQIRPGSGRLGTTVLYINGIEVARFKKEQLVQKDGTYELVVRDKDYERYFIRGAENIFSVKSWTADQSVSSRGLIVKAEKGNDPPVSPNLYAVITGISDYKGEELDLMYAAKDAADFSAVLSSAARKLLNTDGKEHVFTYNLITAEPRYQLPEKNAIKKVLQDIGEKASSNDILLIFFAGHGIMSGKDKKQFYFLTADASRSTAADAVAEVGISTDELTDWIKPSSIRAQKRVLIFDACNSGQAIRDFVQLGKPEQGYVAARGDEKGQQVKAIEKLNNQSGLIILAASASNQNAYEMSRYSQGLLTYALLKAIKQQPEILENGKFLDVTSWLNAARNQVSALAEGNGARQDPQLNTNNNFNIGLVDDELRNSIRLASQKPLFSRSNFQNADTRLDDIRLRSLIDKELLAISLSPNAAISFSADYEGADYYTINGDYEIKNGALTINVLFVKNGTEIIKRMVIKGLQEELQTLVTRIIAETLLELGSSM